MNALWLAPVIVLAVGMGVAFYVARDAARAARELGEGVARFAEVRAALNGLADETGELRAGLERHGRSRGRK